MKRDGLAGDQSWLFTEQIRVTKEMRDSDKQRGRTGKDIRPRYMVWENVYGALNSPGKENKGKDFQSVLTEIVRIAQPEATLVPMPEDGAWPSAGILYDELGTWSLAWRVHDAQFWGKSIVDNCGNLVEAGTPQRRRRLALVADFGGLSAGEILFESEGLSGDFETGGEARQGTPADPERSFDSAGGGVLGLDCFDQCLTGTVSKTLTSSATDSDHVPCVLQQIVFENHSQDSRYRYMGDVNETVSAKYGTGGNNQPLVLTIVKECGAY